MPSRRRGGSPRALEPANLLQAALLALLVTLLALARLARSELPLFTSIVMMMLAMTLVAAAVTAWGRRAGMAGIWTDARTLRTGLLAALALGLLLWPLQLFWLDPMQRGLLRRATDGGDLLASAFPASVGGRVAAMLFIAGFQTLFLQAAPMSLMARLTGNRIAAYGGCLLLRVYIVHRQAAAAGLAASWLPLLAPGLATGLLGCALFARFGLLPAIVFNAVLAARLLLL